MKYTHIFMLALTFLFVACNTTSKKDENQNAQKGIAINIDGSSTVYPITEAVAEEFKKQFPDIKVSVGVSGTGGGFKKFGRGETDMNDASRPIKPEEDSLAKANNIAYEHFLIAYDGLVVVVNPQNTWCKDITVAELKKIWEPAAQGKIMKWNQIRAEWPNEEIHLFGPGVESGTYDFFTEAIVGKSHSSRGDYTASEDDNVLVQGIASDKDALGFFGMAYYEENTDKLKLVGVDDQKEDNGKGAILPTVETVKNKSYAPLGRPLFIYVNDIAAEKKEVQDFINFYLNNMVKLSSEVGYVPLTDEEANAEKSKWMEFLKQHGGIK
ncbi:MAG TPA: PstS family phosphate ABC transporter substrate-binding protein [Chitinophagales bacterium]|nr:PstS family phosphate ABC transporter substrate-binding protein [Chitinophagales bacterium]HNL85306.1 PstS family phosphate ABC transporter substrate-binding protein [Chitinophagales bacterium]